MKGLKLRNVWANADQWAKRLITVFALFAALAPAWLYFKDILDKNIVWYFRATKELM